MLGELHHVPWCTSPARLVFLPQRCRCGAGDGGIRPGEGADGRGTGGNGAAAAPWGARGGAGPCRGVAQPWGTWPGTPPLPGLYSSSRGIFPEQALPAAAQMNQVIATWKYFVLIKRRARKRCSSTRAGTDEGVPGAYGDRNPADLRLKAELVTGSWEPGRGATLEPGVWRGEPLVEAPRCLGSRRPTAAAERRGTALRAGPGLSPRVFS